MPVEIPLANLTGAERFAIVVSRFNEMITKRLCDGAVETLLAAGIPDESIYIAWVPGAWEIPIVAENFTNNLFDAVICLGAVIRGETTHDQHINRSVSAALSRISQKQSVPVLFGLLTCDTLDQAINRAGGQVGNKGADCAAAAIEMVRLLESLDEGSSDDYAFISR